MDDIFDLLYSLEAGETQILGSQYRRFSKSLEKEIQRRGSEDVILEKLNIAYQKQLSIEDKYSYAITDRLKMVKDLNTLSRIEYEMLGKKIDQDVQKLREESLFGTPANIPGLATEKPIVSFTEFGKSWEQVADTLVNQMDFVGDSLVERLTHVKETQKFTNKELERFASTLELIASQAKSAQETIEGAREAFLDVIDDKVFNKIDSIVSNRFTKIFGLEKPLKGLTDKLRTGLGNQFQKAFEALNPKQLSQAGVEVEGVASGMQNVSKFAGLARFAILGWVGLVIAAGAAIYKAFGLWKQFKETTIDIQKEFGLTADRAKELSKTAQSLYSVTSVIGLGFEENVETVKALYDQFRNVNLITQELGMLSTNYQKAYGLTAEEAAEVLKTNKLILGLTDSAMKAQDDHIVRFSNEIGFSAKEMKLLYADAKLVSMLGYQNIDKLAKTAAKAKMTFADIKGTVDDIFELGDFEGSVEKAAKLMQLGIKVDPFEIQFNLNQGDYDAVVQSLGSAFDMAGKDLEKLSGIERKILVDVLGGESQFQKLQQIQLQQKKDALGLDQKIVNLRSASFDDLLAQTTQVDKLGGIWTTIKRTFEAILARFLPAIDAFFEGFQTGFRPLLESFAIAQEKGEGLFGKAALKNIETWGSKIGGWLAKGVELFQDMANLASMLISPFIAVWNVVKAIDAFGRGIVSFIAAGILQIAGIVGSIIDTVFGTNLTDTIAKFQSATIDYGAGQFQNAGQFTAAAGIGAAQSFGFMKDVEQPVVQEKTFSDSLKEQKIMNDKIDTMIDVLQAMGTGPIDSQKILMALSKAAK